MQTKEQALEDLKKLRDGMVKMEQHHESMRIDHTQFRAWAGIIDRALAAMQSDSTLTNQ